MSVSSAAQARPRGKSRTGRAAGRAAQDGAKLTAVPDPGPVPAPAPAPAADPLAKLGKALGLGQPARPAAPAQPDLPASVIARAAAPGGSAKPATGTRTGPGKAKPGPQPKPATAPKPVRPRTVKTPKPAGPANAKATYTTVDRYIGTVTVAVPGSGEPKVYLCEHGARNGHITEGPAVTCATRLLRNHAGGTAGTQTRPRYWGRYQADAAGSEPAGCGCRFGHKHAEHAVACAKTQAAAAGLTAD
jgi:hypothetical protein